eukprot:gene1171-1509_t
MSAAAVPKLRYFDLSGFGGLAGRGGVVRFFMLANDFRFEEDAEDFGKWSDAKADAIQSGDCPTGHLPVVLLDGQWRCEHLAILRLLAKRLGLYGKDDIRDYHCDSLADAAAEFRGAMLKSAFGSPEEKKDYTTGKFGRGHYYQAMNALLEQAGGNGKHAVGDMATFADAVLFAVLWDDVAVHGEDAALWAAHPKLEKFYRAYMQQEPVLQWCRQYRPDLCL